VKTFDDQDLANQIAAAIIDRKKLHPFGDKTMIQLTASNLISILQIPADRAAVWQPGIQDAMSQFDIGTPLRAAHFIAQIGHESGGLRYTREAWTNSPAQQSYEGAARLGNTEPGDGERFMGRGPMQITGRKNYQALSDALGVDFIGQPALLEQQDYGPLSAGWFWQAGAGLNLGHLARAALEQYGMGAGVDLNDIADLDDIETITYCINGGLNGYQDRCDLLARAREVFDAEVT
jgi:putative chitinase